MKKLQGGSFLHQIRSRKQQVEEGFTLIELMIAVLVLGILSSTAVLVMNGQIRNSIIASVKSDVRNSLSASIAKNGAFITPDIFATHAIASEGNSVYLSLDGEGYGSVACVWGTHIFSENDVVSYYWSSDTGKISEGTCLGEGGHIGEIDAGVDQITNPEEDDHEESEDTQPPVGETIPEEETPPAPDESEEETVPVVVAPVTPTPVPAPPVVIAPEIPTNVGKVVICHSKGGNKWNSQSPNVNGIINGHSSSHTADIIPPIAGYLPQGRNWNAAGITVWENGCKK